MLMQITAQRTLWGQYTEIHQWSYLKRLLKIIPAA